MRQNKVPVELEWSWKFDLFRFSRRRGGRIGLTGTPQSPLQ